MIVCTYLEQSLSVEAARRGHITWHGLRPHALAQRAADRPSTWVLIHFSLRYSDEHICGFFRDPLRSGIVLEGRIWKECAHRTWCSGSTVASYRCGLWRSVRMRMRLQVAAEPQLAIKAPLAANTRLPPVLPRRVSRVSLCDPGLSLCHMWFSLVPERLRIRLHHLQVLRGLQSARDELCSFFRVAQLT